MTVYRVEEDDDIDLTPRERIPKPQVETVLLFPDLSNDEAEDKWTNEKIDPATIKYRPRAATYYQTPGGKAKLLFLPHVLEADLVAKGHETVRNIKYSPVSGSKRTCLRGSPGGEAIFGYNDDLIFIPAWKRRQTYPQWTAPSVHQFPRFRALWPLCWRLEEILREHLPTYFEGREIDDIRGPAFRHESEKSDFFKFPEKYKASVKSWEDWGFWYNIPGSNFTTITVNHNTRFLGHKDSNNSSGALSCMTVFGQFAGGELCFPRLGVCIDARQGDMLVCDCPQEIHGTLSTPQGNRYSVVVYTRHGLTKQGRKSKAAKGGM